MFGIGKQTHIPHSYDIVFPTIRSLISIFIEGISVECSKIIEHIKASAENKVVRVPDGDNNNLNILQMDRYFEEKCNVPNVVFSSICNRGKTWIINNLCGTTFPESKSNVTEGLSIINCKEMNCVDTRGLFSIPKLLKSDVCIESKIGEHFQLDLQLALGDVQVIVVDELDNTESSFLISILGMIEESPTKKLGRPIVVHNCQKIKVPSDARNITLEQLKIIFESVTVEVDSKLKLNWFKSPKATHIVLVDNSTPAGKEHNNLAFDFLRSRLKTVTQDYVKNPKPKGILQDIVDLSNKLIHKYVRSKKGNLPQLVLLQSADKFTIQPKDLVLDQKDLCLAPHTFTYGINGLQIEFDSNSLAPYSLLRNTESFQIYLRAPREIEYESSFDSVTISGVIKPPYQEGNGNVSHSTLKFGPFKYEIKIPQEYKVPPKYQKLNPQYVDGMWSLTFPRRNHSQGPQKIVPSSEAAIK